MFLIRKVCITSFLLYFTSIAATSFQVQHHVTKNTSQYTGSGIRDINLHELDKRIIKVLRDPVKHSSQGTQLKKDVSEYYSYLGEMANHIDQNNNLHLLRIILTHPPEFITVSYDEEKLSDVFSWTKDQLEDFTREFEGSFLLWKRLESMGQSIFNELI